MASERSVIVPPASTGGGASALAADVLEEHALAVDGDLELVRMLEPADHFQIVPEERDGEIVLAVERERVLDRKAADGAERKPVEMLCSATGRR